MVHRDIKPQNLMVTPKGQVKILDFGLAGLVSDRQDGSITEFGQGLGTPDFAAPEQIRDAHSADIRADIYSLGCTLYFLLTGHPPFPEGTAYAKVAGHLERTPQRLASCRTDLPEGLVQVVEKMMAKEPAQRFQTPFEVVRALGVFAGSEALPFGLNWKRWMLAGAGAGVAILGAFGYRHAGGTQEPAKALKEAAQPIAPAPADKPSGRGQPDKKIENKKVSSDDAERFVK